MSGKAREAGQIALSLRLFQWLLLEGGAILTTKAKMQTGTMFPEAGNHDPNDLENSPRRKAGAENLRKSPVYYT